MPRAAETYWRSAEEGRGLLKAKRKNFALTVSQFFRDPKRYCFSAVDERGKHEPFYSDACFLTFETIERAKKAAEQYADDARQMERAKALLERARERRKLRQGRRATTGA